MPAPVRRTVFSDLLVLVGWARVGEGAAAAAGAAVRKRVRAERAPGMVLALRGIILAGGSGEVYGIRMRCFVIG